MAKGPQPWFEERYRIRTAHFTCAAQHGIYKNLCQNYWVNGPLIDNDSELRKIAGASAEEWAAYWPAIQTRYFRLRNGRWHQKRVDADLERREKWKSKVRSAAGTKGAFARWRKKKLGAASDPGADVGPRSARAAQNPHKTGLNGHHAPAVGGGPVADMFDAGKSQTPQDNPAQSQKKGRLHDDWQPTEAVRLRCRQLGLTDAEIDHERERFVLYFTGPDAARPNKSDWGRAFTGWCLNEAQKLVKQRDRGALSAGAAGGNGRGPGNKFAGNGSGRSGVAASAGRVLAEMCYGDGTEPSGPQISAFNEPPARPAPGSNSTYVGVDDGAPNPGDVPDGAFGT